MATLPAIRHELEALGVREVVTQTGLGSMFTLYLGDRKLAYRFSGERHAPYLRHALDEARCLSESAAFRERMRARAAQTEAIPTSG